MSSYRYFQFHSHISWFSRHPPFYVCKFPSHNEKPRSHYQYTYLLAQWNQSFGCLRHLCYLLPLAPAPAALIHWTARTLLPRPLSTQVPQPHLSTHALHLSPSFPFPHQLTSLDTIFLSLARKRKEGNVGWARKVWSHFKYSFQWYQLCYTIYLDN